eukprot:TRINITY_DN19068_c0_g1_i1.p1 TRINITY_DN19068_c0_g1~~TRINITY_DN19068_c0_g1_i1.p1  ORF type:complete len:286 (+),score=52.16 TRINITY_DN19068_c0_g1_i1:142-999(+)
METTSSEGERVADLLQSYKKEAKPDWDKSAEDYAKHRASFTKKFYDRLESNYDLPPSSLQDKSQFRVLDLATGTGIIAREFAKKGCSVTATDVSEGQINQAKILDSKQNVHINYSVGKAEVIEAPDNHFDLVIVGNAWHWFDSDATFKEVQRVLKKPTGKLVICHMDWVTYPGEIADLTEDLVIKHNPNWKKLSLTGFWPQWAMKAGIARYNNIETFSYVEKVSYTHDSWVGRMRAMSGVLILPPEKVSLFCQDLYSLLSKQAPSSPFIMDHRIWAVIAEVPSSK